LSSGSIVQKYNTKNPLGKNKDTNVDEDAMIQAYRRYKQMSCWQRYDDFIWLSDHQYFYICCIHEYGGPAWLRKSPTNLLILRIILLIIIMLVVAYNLYEFGREKI
jgi:hypothetical protein